MTPLPPVVSREEWLAARTRLLEREKELTRARDALNGERRRIGMVRVEKDYGSDFNRDFGVTVGEDGTYNYRPGQAEPGEYPAYSAFLRDGDAVFHTYSTYARGTESVGGAHYFLDLTALGRQQEFERRYG